MPCTRLTIVLYTCKNLCNIEHICSVLQVRLPLDTTDDVDEDPTGNRALWDRGLLNGASQKVSEKKLTLHADIQVLL